jgi:hypothetical protein
MSAQADSGCEPEAITILRTAHRTFVADAEQSPSSAMRALAADPDIINLSVWPQTAQTGETCKNMFFVPEQV